MSTSQSTHTACHKIDGGMIMVTTRITFVPDSPAVSQPPEDFDTRDPDENGDYDDWDDFGRGTD